MVVAGCDVFGGIFLDFFEHGSAMVRCSIEQREECLWDAALFALWNITWIWHLGCAFWCSLLYLGLSAKQSQLSAAVSRIQILFTASWEFAVAYLAAASRWQWRCVGWGEGLAAGQRARSQGMVPGRWLS